MKNGRMSLLSVFLALGLAGCVTTTWKSHWGKVREPVDTYEVSLFYAPSEVPYTYVELATGKVKPRPSHGKPAVIPHVNRQVNSLRRDAAKIGASGLILSTPEAPRFPPICLADNAKDEPVCEHLSLIEAIAIAPKD
jgi:hypothetical protein